MADSRFFRNEGPFSLKSLAEAVGAEARAADDARMIADVAPLSTAGADQISFLDNRNYIKQFQASAAGACIVHPDLAALAPAGMDLLVTPEPYRAYAAIAALFYPRAAAVPGIHPRAVVDETAVVDPTAQVDAGAVIGALAEIGAGTIIGPNAVIGEGVVIGPAGSVGANASLSHTIAGAKVHIYPGCRIGQDGFGFAMGPKGHLKVPQLGRVLIGDDVEIGANTTIDRGAGPDTVIGSGCRIDNLVQIGHNVELGMGCVVVSQVGISGSTKLGRFVVLGGQTGVAGHLSLGDGVQVAAQSGIMRDIDPGTTVMGYPAKPIKEFWREVAAVGKLAARKPTGPKTQD
ncbi:UDP-3-O-(3-hydroxymyristoyl)glucosamine N-acyltransferase [Novispirillum itersonii]|uniref:UDP-3-O-acylglucosamine N-acyltransferase n=1 Tax=Novispirillum itersonii TaxID=189 RepID=A0A7X0DNE4_NOVIT|nr:UDP-3-O-(3-hydroxymyristoyl)glucosamine N-acyltransferase [Novispirillum itersonii]MBB6210167.1 UDP-3-O-[3-hydroxymyristoyl] glucosamine N-acyltransferase [Novispirillum itersonii]